MLLEFPHPLLAIHQNTSNKLYFSLWAERTLATSSVHIPTALTGTFNQLLTSACQHSSEAEETMTDI